jgi:FecR protein
MTALRALFAVAAVVAWGNGAARAQDAESAPPAEAGVMTVSSLEGNATAARAGLSPQPLAAGAMVHEHDVIETAPGGRVEISFANGTLLRIGESSRVLLREAPPSGGAFRARLLLGNLWAKVHKLIAGEHFEVETENAVAGVRGTEFRVEAAGSKGDDLVRVYEGAVEVKAQEAGAAGGGWSHKVEPNRELRFSRGAAPAGPAAFDAASEAKHPFMSWVRARPTARGTGAPGTKPGVTPADEKKRAPGKDKKHDPKDQIRRERKAELKEERRRLHLL